MKTAAKTRCLRILILLAAYILVTLLLLTR